VLHTLVYKPDLPKSTLFSAESTDDHHFGYLKNSPICADHEVSKRVGIYYDYLRVGGILHLVALRNIRYPPNTVRIQNWRAALQFVGNGHFYIMSHDLSGIITFYIVIMMDDAGRLLEWLFHNNAMVITLLGPAMNS
jgi:hypothetical protein